MVGDATASESVTLPEGRFMKGGRGSESRLLLFDETRGSGRLSCIGTGRFGPSVAVVNISIDGIGSSGTGELGAEYRLFILILTGFALDSLRDLRNAGVVMRIFAGSADGRIGFGESVLFIFLIDEPGVGSWLSDRP